MYQPPPCWMSHPSPRSCHLPNLFYQTLMKVSYWRFCGKDEWGFYSTQNFTFQIHITLSCIHSANVYCTRTSLLPSYSLSASVSLSLSLSLPSFPMDSHQPHPSSGSSSQALCILVSLWRIFQLCHSPVISIINTCFNRRMLAEKWFVLTKKMPFHLLGVCLLRNWKRKNNYFCQKIKILRVLLAFI